MNEFWQEYFELRRRMHRQPWFWVVIIVGSVAATYADSMGYFS